MKKNLLLSVFCTGMFICATAQSSMPPAYKIMQDTAAYVLLPPSAWQILADTSGNLSFEDALSAAHFQDTDRSVNYKVHVYWLRFRFVNDLPTATTIALPERAAKVDLYTQINGGEWNHDVTGEMVRWSKRAGLKRVPAFTLTIPAGATVTVYKRVYWNYVAFQPDSMSASFTPAEKLIHYNYVQDDSFFMTSLQDAFMLGLFILSMIISFYFFLVVREKEFLYFSIYLLLAGLESIPSLNDVFFREHPQFLLYLYIISNSLYGFVMIHAFRWFLKTFDHFPGWDKVLIVFSFVQVVVLLASHFEPTLFHINVAAVSHFSYNLFMLLHAVIVLITLFLYIRKHDLPIRLMIIAYTPVMLLAAGAYTELLVYGLYAPRLGSPTISGYATSFNKIAFFILILCFTWMIVFFNWVMFLRFYKIRKRFQQQKELDHLKSRFFANISHEFRTPLTLIIGPVEDLLTGGDKEQFKKVLPVVHHNAKRLLQLINQLLDLSKLDAHNYQVNTTREDIIPFTKQIVHSFSSLAEKKNIHLELKADPDLTILPETKNTSFYFDEDVMEKIVTNLLSNALKFTGEGGEIIVSLQLAGDKKEYLDLKVADNGIGIPAEKLNYIFDRFYQAAHSAKRLYEGSGIGLSLVKELVELHGGTITASSRLNKGTTFRCLFPLNHKILTDKAASPGENIPKPALTVAELEEEPPSSGDSSLSNKTNHDKSLILIVEDNEDVRKYIAGKLQDQYTTLEAVNGKMGLDIALKEIPDLVISDVMMPVMDGFELCKKLKTDDRTSHIPVILLTARAEDKDKLQGLETGADAYLVKPFNSKELKIRVHNLIALRKKLRAKFSGKLVVKPSEITVTSLDRQFMQRLLSAVEDHIGDAQFSVDQLAEEMDMSISQLYRKLKALIDQSAQQFIRSVRMQRALDLLKSDSGTVSEIAWKVGFEDPGYFSKVFKSHFDCLPSEKEKYPV